MAMPDQRGGHRLPRTRDGGDELLGPRTLADLAGSPEIRASDILEAIQYRSLDRKLFS
jgi:predicted ATPase with chaperone activity